MYNIASTQIITGPSCSYSTSTANNHPLNTSSLSYTQSSSSLSLFNSHHHHHHQLSTQQQQQQQNVLIGGLNLTSINSTNNIAVSSAAAITNSIGLNLSSGGISTLHPLQNETVNQSSIGGNSAHILPSPPSSNVNLELSSPESSHRSNIPHSADLGMSHWLNEPTASVKSENRSPTLDGTGTGSLMGSGLSNSSHLDSSSLFCSNPSSSGLDSLQNSSSFDQKQDYYNYYNGMQQYTPSFYSSYTSPYPSRTPKIASPNAYLPSSYASAAAAAAASVSNNNASQLYSSYGYNNFSQFSGTQQDYSSYYNDQYNGYYNPPSYSPYVSTPASSGSQSFHVASGLSESPSDAHATTPTLLTHSHSPHSSLSLSPSTPSISTKSTPTTKTGRARGRRHAQPSPTRSTTSDNGQTLDSTKPPERVFIWDLDETIIIFHSLLTGGYANRYSKDPIHMNILGTGMEELIFNMADNHFFFNDIEGCDQVHIDDVSSDDNGQELTNYNFTTDGFHANSTPGTLDS